MSFDQFISINDLKPDNLGSIGIAVEWAGSRKLYYKQPKQEKWKTWGTEKEKNMLYTYKSLNISSF